ncbi:MAG: TetR/AcrR family transcriptional regulator [Burkholderiaceae bacterium]|nr:TetR/AcrR family transcriptional regulator [Burkholderiaceae bacterium]
MNNFKEVAVVSKKPGKRAVKADQLRRALFAAAATVVGKCGYEGASVAAITKLAGVANGTFYNYFETRQKLFDLLLPYVGEQLLAYIRSRVHEESGVELERQRIVAYFEFFRSNPGFLRILNEAEVFAPRAFKQHVNGFARLYERSLKRQLARGELGPYEESEIEAIVYILMGARSYLTMLGRAKSRRGKSDIDKVLIGAYMKLMGYGLFSKK